MKQARGSSKAIQLSATTGSILTIAAGCLLGGGGAALFTATPVSACNTTTPGTSCAPDSLATSTSSTFVARQDGTLDSCTGSTTTCFNASYVEEVYRDPANSFCSGCLDWLIQLKDNTIPNSDTVDPIESITIGSFKNFETDQGVDTNPPPPGSQITTSGTASPCTVSRDASGTVLHFSFTGGASSACPEILPGETTVILDVMTNARTLVPGEISAQDQSAAEGPGLAPAVPEAPVVAGFMGVGGGAAALVLRRRRRRA